MKKKTRKMAKKIVGGAAIVGGVAAAGYAASKLLQRDDLGLPREQGEPHFTDADRAIDFEPGSNFDYGKKDIVGDPSARTSVGLETRNI